MVNFCLRRNKLEFAKIFQISSKNLADFIWNFADIRGFERIKEFESEFPKNLQISADSFAEIY